MAVAGERDPGLRAPPKDDRNGGLGERRPVASQSPGTPGDRASPLTDAGNEQTGLITRSRLLLGSALIVAVLIGLYLLIPKLAGLRQTWLQLRRGDPLLLAVGAMLELLSIAGYATLFRTVFGRGVPRIDWRVSLGDPPRRDRRYPLGRRRWGGRGGGHGLGVGPRWNVGSGDRMPHDCQSGRAVLGLPVRVDRLRVGVVDRTVSGRRFFCAHDRSSCVCRAGDRRDPELGAHAARRRASAATVRKAPRSARKDRDHACEGAGRARQRRTNRDRPRPTSTDRPAGGRRLLGV